MYVWFAIFTTQLVNNTCAPVFVGYNQCDASLLFHCLDPETILFIVAAVVTEQRIVLTAQRTSWLTPVAETILGVHYFASGFSILFISPIMIYVYLFDNLMSSMKLPLFVCTALIHPFEWQGVYMPLLPIQLIDYVSAPGVQ